MADKFEEKLRNTAFLGYGEYMEYLFACVNIALNEQLERMKMYFLLVGREKRCTKCSLWACLKMMTT